VFFLKLGGLALLLAGFMTETHSAGSVQQVTVVDTGSTNRPGLRVTVDPSGSATVEQRRGGSRQIKLPRAIVQRLLRDVEAAGPLASLPARHCFKSASFGSKLFVEANGASSPDLSCPSPADTHLEALVKSAQEVLEAAYTASGFHKNNVIE
jgi:hypothetical protein